MSLEAGFIAETYRALARFPFVLKQMWALFFMFLSHEAGQRSGEALIFVLVEDSD